MVREEASDEVQLAESPDEAYVVMAKVRCFSCKIWGHFSRNCPLKENASFKRSNQLKFSDVCSVVTNTMQEEPYFVELEKLQNGEPLVSSGFIC